MKSGRTKTSPFRYDRAAIRLVLETHGREAALARWPQSVVDPIARILGLTRPYKNHRAWNPEWNQLLGTKPDSVIAGELGLPRSSVRHQRVMLGIPTPNYMALRTRLRALLASISDEELAGSSCVIEKKFSVSQIEVAAERKRRALKLSPRQGLRRNGRGINVPELRRVAVCAIRDAYPNATLDQIGQVVNCTRERVRQILYLREAESKAVAS